MVEMRMCVEVVLPLRTSTNSSTFTTALMNNKLNTIMISLKLRSVLIYIHDSEIKAFI